MNSYIKILCILTFFTCTFVPPGLAQNNTGDFCQRNADLLNNDGNITLEGHKQLHLENQGWWFNSDTKEWEKWPKQETRWSLEEYKDFYLEGPHWWLDSENNEWKEFPDNNAHETLDCHKKLYLSGPQWWLDSATNEWKRWAK